MAIRSHSPFSLPSPQPLNATNLLSISVDLPDLDTKIWEILSDLSLGWEQGTANQESVRAHSFLMFSGLYDTLKLPLCLPGSLAHGQGGRWKSHPSEIEVGAWWAAKQNTSHTELSLIPPTLLGAAMSGALTRHLRKASPTQVLPSRCFSPLAVFSNI